MKLIMENPNTGVIKKAPVGLSWTTLFFGFFPALFRGDMKWLLIQFIVFCLVGIINNLVFMFIYNKIYITKLLEKGFKVKAVEGSTIEHARQKLGINLPQL